MSTEKPHEIFWDTRLTLRSHPRTRLALRRLVSRLSLDGGLKFLDEEATQEAIASAVWLALEEMTKDRDGLRKATEWLRPFVERVEQLPDQEQHEAQETGRTGSGHGPQESAAAPSRQRRSQK